MSASPAWLTIAFTALAAADSPTPAAALADGIRTLPARHILHHLNRWARHVWRPAAPAATLSALKASLGAGAGAGAGTGAGASAAPRVAALSAGAGALLAALVDAMRRCQAHAWIDVLALMFLADDPWAVEVGLAGEHAGDAERAIEVMRALYESRGQGVWEVGKGSARSADEVGAGGTAVEGLDAAGEALWEGKGGESIAELRCRVAALQLQLDDVTAVVRRNERNTKDLLSSFHFWSMLLLDELKSYKAAAGAGQAGDNKKEGSGSGPGPGPGPGQRAEGKGRTSGVCEVCAREGGMSVQGVQCGEGAASDHSSVSGKGDGKAGKSRERKADGARVKRVFRDGKWVVL